MNKTKVQNLQRMNRKVRAMPAAVKTAIREALATGGDEVVGMMKRLAPVDDGALRDSIGWTFGQPPGGSISVGGFGGVEDARNSEGLRVTIYAGDADAYYARWQEFGTAQHRAHPFFFVAWRALRKRVKSRLTRKINKAIKQVVNSHG